MRTQPRTLLFVVMLSWATVVGWRTTQPTIAQTVTLQPATPGITEQGNINIDGTGLFGQKIGIGTTNPLSMLHLESTANFEPRIMIKASNTGLYSGIFFQGTPTVFGGAFYRHGATNDLLFMTSFGGTDVPQVVIANSGNVGIGATAPRRKLQVKGPAPTDANQAQLEITTMRGDEFMLLGRTASYGFVQSHNGEPLSLNPLGNNVGIGKEDPNARLDVAGDIKAEYNGSPRLFLYSRGNGTQNYSIRATNDNDGAGGARLVVRNESYNSDVITVTGRGGGTSPDRVGIGTSDPKSKLHVVGKATITGGVDPPYISFSAESHESIREYARSVDEHEKVMQFWNSDAHRLEVYVIAEDRFYTITGEPID